jgi:predicted transposase/invertase (TIGR01784 family)
MRFLSPKTDFAFKKIFSSEQSHEILLSFLNAILQLESPYLLADLEILDPYLSPQIRGMKDTYLHVRTRDKQGKGYIIEMLVLNVAGFEKRILYNAGKTYACQIQPGEDDHLLTDVIAITHFVMFEDLLRVVNIFRLRVEDGEVCSDDLVLVFAKLPKFTKTEAQLDSLIDRWFYFLKHAGDLTAIPAPLQNEPAIR